MSRELSPQFRSLFLREFPMLCRLAHNLVDDEAASREIVQNVFVKKWSEAGKILPDTIVLDLRKATIQSCLAFLIKRSTFNRSGTTHNSNYSMQPLDENNPDRGLELTLTKSMSELPPTCSVVFSLSRQEGMNFMDIASMLDMPVESVAEEMANSIRHLRGNTHR